MSFAHTASAIGRLIGAGAASVFAYASYRNMDATARAMDTAEATFGTIGQLAVKGLEMAAENEQMLKAMARQREERR